jgi:hypothetical protein
VAEVVGAAYVQIAAKTEALESGLAQAEALTRKKAANMEAAANRAMSGASNFSQAEIRGVGMAFTRMSSLAETHLGGIGRGISLVGMALYSWPVAAAAAGAALIGWLVKSYLEGEKLRKEIEQTASALGVYRGTTNLTVDALGRMSSAQREVTRSVMEFTGVSEKAVAAAEWQKFFEAMGRSPEEAKKLAEAFGKSDVDILSRGLEKKERITSEHIKGETESERKLWEEKNKEELVGIAVNLNYWNAWLDGRKKILEKAQLGKPILSEGMVRLPREIEARMNEQLEYGNRMREKAVKLRDETIDRIAKEKRATEDAARRQKEARDTIDDLRKSAEEVGEIRERQETEADDAEESRKEEQKKKEQELAEGIAEMWRIGDAQRRKSAEEIAEINNRAFMGQRERRMRDYHDEIDTNEEKKRSYKDDLDERLAAHRENLERMRAEQYQFMAPRDIWRAAVTGQFAVKAAESTLVREERALRQENNRILKDLDISIKSLRDKVDALSQGD